MAAFSCAASGQGASHWRANPAAGRTPLAAVADLRRYRQPSIVVVDNETEHEMGRFRRFEEFRYIGARDTMVFYDCDDGDQFAELEERIEDDGLLVDNLLSTFGPDTPAEARNRGFRARG